MSQRTSFDVPELNGAVIGRSNYKVAVELETGDRGLVLVRAGKCLKAVAADDIPHFNRRICIPGYQYVIPQFHSRGERLMTHQRVSTCAGLDFPHSYTRVQRAANNMYTIKLIRRGQKEKEKQMLVNIYICRYSTYL